MAYRVNPAPPAGAHRVFITSCSCFLRVSEEQQHNTATLLSSNVVPFISFAKISRKFKAPTLYKNTLSTNCPL